MTNQKLTLEPALGTVEDIIIEEKTTSKKLFPRKVYQVFILFFISIIPFVPIGFFEKEISDLIGYDAYRLMVFILVLGCSLVIAFYINKRNKVQLDWPRGPLNLHVLLLSALIFILINAGPSRLIADSIMHIFHLRKISNDNLVTPVLAFGALILAPTLEEAFFRGFVLQGFLSHYKTNVALFLCAFLFALVHATPVMFVHQFFIGYLITYVCFKERNIYMAAAMHFIANFIALGSMYIRSHYETPNIFSNYSHTLLLTYVITTLLVIATVRQICKRYI